MHHSTHVRDITRIRLAVIGDFIKRDQKGSDGYYTEVGLGMYPRSVSNPSSLSLVGN